jgi:hypothetical protein
VIKSRKVASVYLANDLIQKSKHKAYKPKFLALNDNTAFKPILFDPLRSLFEILDDSCLDLKVAVVKVM